MANNFTGDVNCVALWNFESGALTTDSIGTNTLTDNNTVGTNASDFKEGAACADLTRANSEYFSITDADLDAGFPLKSDDSNKKISVCFWFKRRANLTNHFLFSKNDANKTSLAVLIGAIYNHPTFPWGMLAGPVPRLYMMAMPEGFSASPEYGIILLLLIRIQISHGSCVFGMIPPVALSLIPAGTRQTTSMLRTLISRSARLPCSIRIMFLTA